MKKQLGFYGILLVILFSVATSLAVIPQPGEFHFRNEWMGPLLGETGKTVRAHLKLLYEDVTEGIGRGKSWRGTPFQLGERTYTNGLAFNSTKHLEVVLDREAERFVADVGLEN
ncbi:MAG: NPCBM/NEW2 domain-containing protein, partial [Sedimentisphaerales bacterium]